MSIQQQCNNLNGRLRYRLSESQHWIMSFRCMHSLTKLHTKECWSLPCWYLYTCFPQFSAYSHLISWLIQVTSSLMQAVTCQILRMFELKRNVKASAGRDRNVRQSGRAYSVDSLILQSPHNPSLVYHLSCWLTRPRTEIRESKCGCDRIIACAGCSSLSNVPSRLCSTADWFFGPCRMMLIMKLFQILHLKLR